MSFGPENPMRPIYARRDQNTVQFEMPLVKKAQKPPAERPLSFECAV
jgi:hypothetical protein